jgi:predicted MPP superfamily phosphohydrolase
MIIDTLSDLHIDFYFHKVPSKKAVETIYTHIFTDNQKRSPGDVLIVAGDIGHYNKQNIDVLKKIKEVFKYKHIVCVLGNHDYYLINVSAPEYLDTAAGVHVDSTKLRIFS